MLSRVAKYYEGAYPIPELMKLKRYRDLKFWYDRMVREIVENNIINNFNIKKKPIPSPRSLNRMVDKKIRELSE